MKYLQCLHVMFVHEIKDYLKKKKTVQLKSDEIK